MRIFFLLLSLILLTNATAQCQQQVNDMPKLKALSEKMDANLNALLPYTCDYRFGIYLHVDCEGEKNSKLPDVADHQVLLKSRNTKEGFVVDHLDPAHKTREYERNHPETYRPELALSYRGLAMDFNMDLQNSELTEFSLYFPRRYNHPTNLGSDGRGVAPILRAFINGEIPTEYDIKFVVKEDVLVGDTKCVSLKGWSNGSSYITTYYLDPNHGYFPIRTENINVHTNKTDHVETVYGFVEKNGASLPKVAKNVWTEVDGRCQVRFLEVLNFDPKPSPDEQRLSLIIPRETQFWDGSNPNTSKTIFRNSQQEYIEILASDLEKIHRDMASLAVDRAADNAKRFNPQ